MDPTVLQTRTKSGSGSPSLATSLLWYVLCDVVFHRLSVACRDMLPSLEKPSMSPPLETTGDTTPP